MAFPLVQEGITKKQNLPDLPLPPGMGTGHPFAASPHGFSSLLTFQPGEGFNFHKHPSQSEVIYVVAGNVEAWVETEKHIMKEGDVMYAPAGMVHALFNKSDEPLELFVVLSPLLEGVDESMLVKDTYGWELVDMSGEAPYASLA